MFQDFEMKHREYDEHHINLTYVSVDGCYFEGNLGQVNGDIQITYEFQLSARFKVLVTL